METGESRSIPETRVGGPGGCFLGRNQATCGIDADRWQTKSPSRPHCSTEDVNRLIIVPLFTRHRGIPFPEFASRLDTDPIDWRAVGIRLRETVSELHAEMLLTGRLFTKRARLESL